MKTLQNIITAKVTQQACFLALLIDLADTKGIIKLNSRKILDAVQSHKIFSGRCSVVWLNNQFHDFETLEIIKRHYRINPKGRKNLRVGLNFWYCLNPQNINFRLMLNSLPNILSMNALTDKLRMIAQKPAHDLIDEDNSQDEEK